MLNVVNSKTPAKYWKKNLYNPKLPKNQKNTQKKTINYLFGPRYFVRTSDPPLTV